MANRKRNIQMKFYVTEDEKRLIDEKMSQLPTRRYGAYLRKMAIDGYIISLTISPDTLCFYGYAYIMQFVKNDPCEGAV